MNPSTYTLKLEVIGDNVDYLYRIYKNFMPPGIADLLNPRWPRPWVAEIIGFHPKFKFDRRFIKGYKDFSGSNSVGSRGIYSYYHLYPGNIYEVFSKVSWKSSERYFCEIINGKPILLTGEGVSEWLRKKALA